MAAIDSVNYRVSKPVFFKLRILGMSINLQLKNEERVDFEINEKAENRNESKNNWWEVALIDFGFVLSMIECIFYIRFGSIELFDSVLDLFWT